jgi:hypothetical protein
LLRDGTRLGLQRAIEFLAASADPATGTMPTILRAQAALINTLVNSIALVCLGVQL